MPYHTDPSIPAIVKRIRAVNSRESAVREASTGQFGEMDETLASYLMCEAFESRFDPLRAAAFNLASRIVAAFVAATKEVRAMTTDRTTDHADVLPAPCRCGARWDAFVAVNRAGRPVNAGEQAVSCPACGRRGPRAATREAAIEAWNEDRTTEEGRTDG